MNQKANINNAWYKQWWVISLSGAIIAALLSGFATNWRFHWWFYAIICATAFAFILYLNPERIYIKVIEWGMSLIAIPSFFFFKFSGELFGIEFNVQSAEMASGVSIAIVAVMGWSLTLFYLKKNRGSLFSNSSIFRNDINNISQSGDGVNIGQVSAGATVNFYEGSADMTEIKSIGAHLGQFLEAKRILSDRDSEDIKKAYELLESGELNLVFELIGRLREKHWSEQSDENRYKILTILAAAYHKRGEDVDLAEGAQLFVEAFRYNEDSLVAKGYAAVGHAILGNCQKARKMGKEGLEKNPNEGSFWKALIICASDELELEKIIRDIPKEIDNPSSVFFTIAQKYLRFSRSDYAITYFRKTLKFDEDGKSDYLAALGNTILQHTVNTIDLVLNQYDKNAVELIREGISYLERAWDTLKTPYLRKIRAYWLMNIGNALHVIGDFPGSHQKLVEAYKVNPEERVFKESLAASFVRIEEPEKALQLINDLQKDEYSQRLSLLAAEINLATGNGRNSEDDLRMIIESEPKQANLSNRRFAFNLLFRIYLKEDSIEKAKSVLRDFEAAYPSSLDIKVAEGLLQKATGDFQEAKKVFEHLADQITPDSDPTAIQTTAEQLFLLNSYAHAAKAYQYVVNPKVNSEVNQRFIYSLYNSHERAQALRICKNLEDRIGSSQFLLEIQVILLELSGNLAEAIKICEEYIKNNQNAPIASLLLTYLQIKVQKLDAAIDHFSNLQVNQLELWHHKIAYANLANRLGKVRIAIEFAYELWREKPDDSAVSDAITNIFLSEDKNNGLSEWQRASKVNVDKAVYLVGKSDGEKRTIIIVDSSITSLLPNEVWANSLDGENLIGCKVGETISLTHPEINAKEYEIVEIIHKHAFAFRSSLAVLEHAPEDAGISKVRTLDLSDDKGRVTVQPLLDELEARAKSVEEAYSLYQQGGLPIYTLCQLSGSDIFSTLDYLMREEDSTILAAHPNQPPNPQNIFELDSKFIVDIISIYTIHAIGFETIFVRLFKNRIYIVQSTLDLLQQKFYSIQKGLTIVSYCNGAFGKKEYSDSEIESLRNQISEIHQWCVENFSIVPVESSLELTSDEKKKWTTLIGTSAFHTILAADEHCLNVISDDSRFRQLGFEMHGSKGLSIAEIIWKAWQRNEIPEGEKDQFFLQLICNNYKYFIVDHQLLFFALEESKLSNQDPWRKAIKTIGGKYLVQNRAVIIALELLREISLNITKSDERDRIAMEVLENLVVDRDFNTMVDTIQAAILYSGRFELIPLQQKDLLELLDIWKTTRSAVK